MSASALPRLLDRKRIAQELGITLASAETLMRDCPLVRIGRRVASCRRGGPVRA